MIINIFYCLCIVNGLFIFYMLWRIHSRREHILHDNDPMPETRFLENRAVDMNALTHTTFSQRLRRNIDNILANMGNYAVLKVISFYIVVSIIGIYLLDTLFLLDTLSSLLLILPTATILGIKFQQARIRKAFENSFPDALNMIASSVSAGESLLHSIVFVGDTLDSIVGKEFKRMGERLNMGQTVDDVFRKSCQRFPTPTFQFFVITMRVNINRGGQLREVITRLNRILFDARAIEMKKRSMTAEARMSSYIVCAIPFLFLFVVMRFLSPDNYDFVMHHPDGRPLLYYMLASEAIGISIIISLMRSVR